MMNLKRRKKYLENYVSELEKNVDEMARKKEEKRRKDKRRKDKRK